MKNVIYAVSTDVILAIAHNPLMAVTIANNLSMIMNKSKDYQSFGIDIVDIEFAKIRATNKTQFGL